MVTDIHCHFIPGELIAFHEAESAFEARRERAADGGTIYRARGRIFGLNEVFFDPTRQIARLDELGIDRGVISLATPLVDYHVEPAFGRKAAQICNDGFAALVAAHPDRFAAWAYLPMQDPEAAAAELRRCVRDLRFIGGHVATNVRGAYLPDERFVPVVKAARDLDVPLFLHPVDPAGADRTRDYELTVVAGYPFDSTINILRMICSGFLDRHRGLKLVCTHTGSFSLMLRSRAQREVDTNPSLSGTLSRPVGDYLAELYYDTVCFEPDYLRFATTVVPPEHLLLGSDAPFPLGEPDPVNFVRRALPPELADLALSRNYDRLLGA